jgi:glutathione S-transferase
MIPLYGRGQSRSFRALWAIEKSGLDYEYINVQRGGDVPSHLDIALRARYDEIAFFVMSDLEQPLWSIGKHQFVLTGQ